MSKISRPDLTAALTKFFLSAGENPNPSELGEEVLFTFPFSDPANELANTVNSIASGVAGATVVDHPSVPADEYWLYHSVDVSINDTTGRRSLIQIISDDTSFVLNVVDIVTIAANDVRVVRNLVVPPKWHVRARVTAIGGAFILTSQAMHTAHRLAQPIMNMSS